MDDQRQPSQPKKAERLAGLLYITPRRLSNILIAAAGIAIYVVISNLGVIEQALGVFSSIFSIVFVGTVSAFILNAPMKFFEKYIFRMRRHRKLARRLSIALSYIVISAAIGVVVYVVVPSFSESMVALAGKIPGYVDQLLEIINNGSDNPITVPWNQVGDAVADIVTAAKIQLSGILAGTAGFLISLFAGIALAAFFLDHKERIILRLKGLAVRILRKNAGERLIHVMGMIYGALDKFVIGQITHSLILGVLCFLGMLVFGFPYALMISVIATIANMIPLVGPFLGGMIGTVLILVENPLQGILFYMFISLLQQLDGNVISPKIMGGMVGLTPMWMMFSFTVGGGLFGFMGMLLAIPVFSVVYGIVKSFIEGRLQNKGMDPDTMAYVDT